jgi:hypothetical protein
MTPARANPCGGDGARVGDAIAKVGAMVDAGDDEIGGEAVDQPEPGQPHAVDGRAIGGITDGAVGEGAFGSQHRGRVGLVSEPLAIESGPDQLRR